MSGQESSGIVIGGEPRIDFLPPEVKAGKRVKRSRRGLIGLVLVVVIVCVGGYAGASGLAVDSQLRLSDEQARTSQLLQEQSTFAEVRTVAGLLGSTKDARLVGSATEILWAGYMAEVVAALPAGVVIDTYAVESQEAGASVPVPGTPLQNDRMATATFAATVPGLAEADAVVLNLSSLPGYADAWVSAIAHQADGTYKVDYVLNINASVVEKRFFEDYQPGTALTRTAADDVTTGAEEEGAGDE